MSTNLVTLDSMRVLMDVVDDLYDSIEHIMLLPKKYESRMKHLPDGDISDQDVKQILEKMPPERASALMAALMGLSEFVPVDDRDMKKASAKIESDFKLLKKIRANLHTALDEES